MEPGEVAETLSSLTRGEARAADRLLPLVYGEMRRLAAGYLRGERAGHTLQATALAHEAYLRIVARRGLTWQDRGHFMGLAARALRQILVDHARRRRAQKRGNAPVAVPLDEAFALPERPVAFDDLDEALDRLARLSERQARVVELRYVVGPVCPRIRRRLVRAVFRRRGRCARGLADAARGDAATPAAGFQAGADHVRGADFAAGL